MKRILLLAAAAMLCATASLQAEESTPLPQDAVKALKDKSAVANPESADRVVRALADLVTVNPDDEPSLLVLHNRPILTLRSRFAAGMQGCPGSLEGRLAEDDLRSACYRSLTFRAN
jgi:hypothetical protein